MLEKKIEGYEKDCEKLNEMVDNDFCKYAFAILIDNGDEQGNYSIQNKELYITELKNFITNQHFSFFSPSILSISLIFHKFNSSNFSLILFGKFSKSKKKKLV